MVKLLWPSVYIFCLTNKVSQDVTKKISVSLFNIDNFNNYIVVIM
jgi:hypothetical protein